jgi:hypothetical protein
MGSPNGIVTFPTTTKPLLDELAPIYSVCEKAIDTTMNATADKQISHSPSRLRVTLLINVL